MKTKNLLIILFAFSMMVSMPTFSQHPIQFSHLTVDDGLAQMSVTDILQDSFGYIWFATGDGLCVYDGYSFKTYRHNPSDTNSLSNSQVRVLYEGKHGDIWIGTWGGGLDRYVRSSNIFIHYKNNPNNSNSIGSNFIKGLCLEDDSLLWVSCSYSGLTKFNYLKNEFRLYKHTKNYPSVKNDGYLFQVRVDANKTLWLCAGSGLYVMPYKQRNEGNFLRFSQSKDSYKQIDIANAYEVFCSKNNEVWVGSYGGGLCRINNITFDCKIYKNDPKDTNSLSNNKVTGICQDSDDNLWLATFGGGLDKFDIKYETFIHIRNNKFIRESISKNFLFKTFIDRQNVLWVGTYTGGASKTDLSKKGIQHYKNIENNSNSLLGNSVNSMLCDATGNIWIGTADGGICKFIPSTNTFERFENNSTISQMFMGKDNMLWYGSFYGGFFKHQITNNKITNYKANKKKLIGLVHNRIMAICEGEDGIIWLGMAKGLRYWNPKQPIDSIKLFSLYENNVKASQISIPTLYKDSRNNLWIATEEGLKFLDYRTKKCSHFRIDEKNAKAIKTEVVDVVFEDSQHRLWVGTDIGIFLKPKLDSSNNFIFIDISKYVPNTTINAIEEDANKNMWFSSNYGIFCLNLKTFQIRVLSVADGLQGHEFLGASCFYKTTGELYFGGRNGFNRFHPDSIFNNPYPPEVVINDFYLFNKEVPIGGKILPKNIHSLDEINLTYKDYIFSFSFAGLHFAEPQKNSYAYMLEGFDKQWNYTNASRRYVTYTNVPSGSYIFKVKAANYAGVWNTKTCKIKINIAPPYWETWWFRVLFILFIIAIILIYIKLRIKKLKRQQIILEDLVDKRTIEVRKQKEEILEKNEELNQQREEILSQNEHLEKLNNELIYKNDQINFQHKKITDSIKYAQQIQQALLLSYDEIKKKYPESFIYLKPKDIVSGDFFYFSSIGAYDYFAVVDCTGHGVPGAFMSIIGFNLINQAIFEEHLNEPKDITTYINEGVRKTLYGKSKTFVNDGMDFVLMRYCKNNEEICFAGAINPLYLIRDKKLIIYKTDNHHIGMPLEKTIQQFTQQKIKIQSGDMVYLFSDGYADQFNTEGKQKYSLKNFRETLINMSSLTCQEQYKQLDDSMKNWQQSSEQIDDMLILGIRF